MTVRLKLFSAISALLGMAALGWHVEPCRPWLESGRLLSAAQQLQPGPVALLSVVIIYVLGGLLSVPILVLIPATAAAFGMMPGACYAALGLLASALILYGLGHALGHDAVCRLAGPRMRRVNMLLARHGLLTMAMLRLLPVLPYSVVNLAAGAARIRLGSYVLGTMLGLLPAIAIMSFMGARLRDVLAWPVAGYALVLFVIAVLALTASWLRRIWIALGTR